MKKIISCICAFTMIISCSLSSFAAVGTKGNIAGLVYAPVNGVDMPDTLSLTIEAEDMISSKNMTLVDDADASGNKAMKFTGIRVPEVGYDEIQKAFKVKPNPDLMININIPQTTAYQVWARVKTEGETLNYTPIWHRFDEYGKYYSSDNSIFGLLYNLPSNHPDSVHKTAGGATTATSTELNYIQFPFKYRLKYIDCAVTSEYKWISIINSGQSVVAEDGTAISQPNDRQYILKNGKREFSLLLGDKDIVIDKIYIAAANAFNSSRTNFFPTDEKPTIESAGFSAYDVFPTTHNDFPEMKLAGQHPRLFITANEIQDYKAKLTTNKFFAKSWENIQSLASQNVNGRLPINNNECNNNLSILNTLQARALMYLIGEADTAYAKKTVKELKNFMSTVTFNLDEGANTTYNTRNIGTMMVTAALVYDWCYDVMTFADREYIITRLKEMAKDKETSWPPLRQTHISSHRQEEVIYLHETIAAIAFYDEDPEWYDIAMSTVYDRMRDIRIFGAQSGYDHSAGSYFEARNKGPLYLDKMLHVTGGLEKGETIFGNDYKKAFDHIIYRGLPNGLWFKDGDDYHWDSYDGKTKITDTSMIPSYVGYTYDNPYLLSEGLQSYTLNEGEISIIDTFMFDTDKEIKFIDDLPTTYMSTYPMTSMVARTGWNQGVDSPDAMVYMSMHDTYLDGHQHADTGTFQLWYKGMLALNSGYYTYNPHYYHYHSRSIANNVLLVDNFDPDFYQHSLIAEEKTANDSTNDGGQKNTGLKTGSTYEEYLATLNRVDENGNIEYGENSLAYEKAHYIGPNEKTPMFSYLSSDISGAYNYQNPRAIGYNDDNTRKYEEAPEKKLADSGYERSMVFMDLNNDIYPAAFIVYDNVTSVDADYGKTWLLHTEEEPVIDSTNNKTTAVRTQNGLSGKLVNTTLYPKDADIVKVGGSGKDFLVTGLHPDFEESIVREYSGVNSTDSLDTAKKKIKEATGFDDYYDPSGNFVKKGELNITPNKDFKTYYPDNGAYRIEISPKTKSATDIFLNAMYVTDADTAEDLPMDLIEDNENYVGVSVLDRVVTFSRTRDNIDESITLTVPEKSDKIYCLVTDMAAGNWKIEGNGKIFYVESKGDSGKVDENTGAYSLCFEVAPGTYTISPVSGEVDVTELSVAPKTMSGYGDFKIFSNGNLLNVKYPTIFENEGCYVSVDDLVKLLNDDATVTVEDSTITFNAHGYTDSDGKNSAYEFTVGSTDWTKDGKTVYQGIQTYQFTKPPIEKDGVVYMDVREFRLILGIAGSYNPYAKLLTLTYYN